MTEDEKVGWHHQFHGREFEQTVGDSEVQGSLVCCSSWGSQKLDTSERLNEPMKECSLLVRYISSFS